MCVYSTVINTTLSTRSNDIIYYYYYHYYHYYHHHHHHPYMYSTYMYILTYTLEYLACACSPRVGLVPWLVCNQTTRLWSLVVPLPWSCATASNLPRFSWVVKSKLYIPTHTCTYLGTYSNYTST